MGGLLDVDVALTPDLITDPLRLPIALPVRVRGAHHGLSKEFITVGEVTASVERPLSCRKRMESD